ncbi:hypothetical protein [Microbacterium sp. GXF0217]
MTSAVHATARPASPAGAASPVPMGIGIGALAVSLVIAVLVMAGFSAPVELFFGVPLPLVLAEYWWLSFVGYLLTPLIVIACYGWDVIGQRGGLRRNANFAIRTRYTSILRWTLWPAVVVGVWHILNLSVPLSEAWGLS